MTKRLIHTLDALNTLVKYYCVDYRTVSANSFFQQQLNLSDPEAQVLLMSLERDGFMEQGMGQTWITESGRNELERLKKA